MQNRREKGESAAALDEAASEANEGEGKKFCSTTFISRQRAARWLTTQAPIRRVHPPLLFKGLMLKGDGRPIKSEAHEITLQRNFSSGRRDSPLSL